MPRARARSRPRRDQAVSFGARPGARRKWIVRRIGVFPPVGALVARGSVR
jgi:hypothetical protein